MKGRSGGPRITAGRLAGRRLEIPAGIRPSPGKLREALFSIWSDELEGASLLDLFAGSGAIAIEAWSRGARSATVVESDRRVLSSLRRNLALAEEPLRTRLLAESVSSALGRLQREGARFDLLFADPPYELLLDAEFFASARAIAAPAARLAIEHRAGAGLEAAPEGWRRSSLRRYGDSALGFYELAGF